MLLYKGTGFIKMNKTNNIESNNNTSIYTRNINLLEDDPLEEIFALNLGDFFTEHLINPEFANKISKKAHEKGIIVSCDLNYRKKLWSREKAGQVMSELCKYVDVCISNEEDASDVFGIKSESTDVTSGKLNKDGYREVASRLKEKFGFKYVAITLRTSISASENNWAGMLYDGKTGECHFSKEYNMKIVDRVGGGDSFGGGLIYALSNDFSAKDAIEFAVAASCLKHSIEGDFNMVSVSEVQSLAGGNASGRVQR